MDLQEGGTFEVDGKTFVIEPDENRIHGALWRNGARIEVFYYPPEVEMSEHASDRMKIRITDCNGSVKGWHLNVEDALEMIEGLSKGMKMCLEDGIPYNAAD